MTQVTPTPSQTLTTERTGDIFKPGARPYANQYAKNGFRYDVRATAMMVEDLLFDPVLACKVLLDVDLPPHQELRLLMMWVHSMTLDDSGFSTGKTFTAAICISLRSVLMQNRISGVISKSFRQGKLIFAKIEGWANNNKIFRNCIKHYNGKPRIIHDQEVHQIHWRGGSTLRVLPPNFLKDADGLKSERWNDGYCDEWNSYGNEHALTTTIYGRVTEANDFEACPVRQNHLHLFSTPRFKHHASYRLVEATDKDIKLGNTDCAHFTCNYRHIPRTKKWKKLTDRKRIRMMQINNSPGVVGAEIDGVWQDDSKTYYSSIYVDAALELWEKERSRYPILTERLHVQDTYLCTYDMARGSQDPRIMKGDDFGFVVWRIPVGCIKGYPCFAFRRNGAKAGQASAVLHKYHQKFGFSLMGYDPQGGGMFVYDELTKPKQHIGGQEVAVTPLVDIQDRTGLLGDRIVIPIRRTTDYIRLHWGKDMRSDNVLVNRMHNLTKNALENYQLPLPSKPEILEKQLIDEVDEIREFLHKNGKMLSERDKAHCELYLMSRQLAKVDVKRDMVSMEEVRDAQNMLLFSSKTKKDLAYCLVYGVTLEAVYLHLQEMGIIVNTNTSDGETCYGTVQPI